jgi:hypothetical protein
LEAISHHRNYDIHSLLKTWGYHARMQFEEFMPKDNFYRQLEGCINIEFTCEIIQDLYSPFE